MLAAKVSRTQKFLPKNFLEASNLAQLSVRCLFICLKGIYSSSMSAIALNANKNSQTKQQT